VKNVFIWGGLGLLAFVTFNAWFPQEDSPKSHDRQVIELCWQDYEKKSNDAQTKLILAKACENLEKKFVETYGVKP